MAKSSKEKSHTPKIASLELKGSRLEDFLPLLPAEEQLKSHAANGEICIVGDYNNERPNKPTNLNTIRGGFLRYMVLGGCEQSPIHARGIGLLGACIQCEDFLDFEAIEICKDLKLHQCLIDGNIVLSGARTQNISFSASRCKALLAERCTISGNLVLDQGFTAEETIRLSASNIEGNMLCENAHLTDKNNSLIANRAKITGDVDLENIIAKGTIALTGTEISGDITPQGAILEGTPALQLRNSRIGGTLVWRSLKHVNGEVDFSGASCKTINTDGDNWMRKREGYYDKFTKDDEPKEHAEETKKPDYVTKLDNFTYEGFSNLPDNCKAEFWIEFLSQQPEDHLLKNFKPRPWEQLAGVLDSMGYQEEALEVRIEKQKLQTGFMASHEPAASDWFNLWHWGQIFFRKFLWGPLVGYGYKPGNALVYLFGIVLIGTAIYHQAAKRGIMTPTHPLVFKEARSGGSMPSWCAENWVYFPDESCVSAMPSEYSEFQAFIYAADIALPVVNLRMQDDWAPRVVHTDGTRDSFGWWVRIYEWFLIAAGWILSLLFVSAVGSSIRK
jgi:cytoskeletal protein CcmA (bactofilin family)